MQTTLRVFAVGPVRFKEGQVWKDILASAPREVDALMRVEKVEPRLITLRVVQHACKAAVGRRCFLFPVDLRTRRYELVDPEIAIKFAV